MKPMTYGACAACGDPAVASDNLDKDALGRCPACVIRGVQPGCQCHRWEYVRRVHWHGGAGWSWRWRCVECNAIAHISDTGGKPVPPQRGVLA